MLRDERLALLSDLLRQVHALARHYRACAELMPDRATAALMQRLSSRREGLAARLGHHARALGDLPDAEDPEREWIRELGERLRVRLVDAGAAALLRERVAEEDRLAALAHAALQQPLPEAVRSTLRSARDDARSVAARLRHRQSAGSRRDRPRC